MIAALADSAGGADTKYQSMITGPGRRDSRRHPNGRSSKSGWPTRARLRDADSVGSVSIDEEMATLVAAQRAFEASAPACSR